MTFMRQVHPRQNLTHLSQYNGTAYRTQRERVLQSRFIVRSPPICVTLVYSERHGIVTWHRHRSERHSFDIPGEFARSLGSLGALTFEYLVIGNLRTDFRFDPITKVADTCVTVNTFYGGAGAWKIITDHSNLNDFPPSSTLTSGPPGIS